jgi:aminoglycoside phosphotransferase (APT) family kinase protein
MEYDERLDLKHKVQLSSWVKKVHQMRENGQLGTWVSTFHPNQLPCRADGNIKFIHGGYNLGQKLIFSDRTAWLVRFAQAGSVCDMLADEKVAMEVETLSRIHEETDVRVPRIHSWGLGTHNPLGLGPFIIMDFIEGVSLESILKEEADKRLMRDDISDSDIEYIYRQFAQILLKLFQLDFDYIGNLPTPRTGFQAPVRPLTFKVHDIIQLGGVNTFGSC